MAERLAGVARLDLHELVGPLLEGVGDPEQGLLPLCRGRLAPGLEGPRRGAVGPVDVLRAAESGAVRVDLPRCSGRGRRSAPRRRRRRASPSTTLEKVWSAMARA